MRRRGAGSIHHNIVTYGAGGGLYADSCALIVTDSEIYQNRAPYAGGGIYTGRMMSARLDGNTFLDNDAGAGTGCALHMTESDHAQYDSNRNPKFDGSRLKDNELASGHGKCTHANAPGTDSSAPTCCTSGTLLNLDNQIDFHCALGYYMPQVTVVRRSLLRFQTPRGLLFLLVVTAPVACCFCSLLLLLDWSSISLLLTPLLLTCRLSRPSRFTSTRATSRAASSCAPWEATGTPTRRAARSAQAFVPTAITARRPRLSRRHALPARSSSL